MTPFEHRLLGAVLGLTTVAALTAWGAIDLAAYTYRIHRALRNARPKPEENQ